MTSAVLTWIGSPLTGVSALIAALSYTKSRREKVLEQASGVHAWINGAMTPVIYRNFDAVTGITHRVAAAELTIDLHLVQIEAAEHVRVHVLNASDHPVYDCHVEIVWDGIFTGKSDRHEDPVIAGPDGSIGFSLRYQDEIRRVNLWTQDWQPWEGESKQWATVLSAVGVDRIPSPLPAKKESYEFSLEQSLIFAADLSVLHTEETQNGSSLSSPPSDRSLFGTKPASNGFGSRAAARRWFAKRTATKDLSRSRSFDV